MSSQLFPSRYDAVSQQPSKKLPIFCLIIDFLIIFAKKLNTMFYTIIGFVAFIAVAIIGWVIAEMKGKSCVYQMNEEEEAAEKKAAEVLHENGFTEMDIHDVVKNISTKGFQTT